MSLVTHYLLFPQLQYLTLHAGSFFDDSREDSGMPTSFRSFWASAPPLDILSSSSVVSNEENREKSMSAVWQLQQTFRDACDSRLLNIPIHNVNKVEQILVHRKLTAKLAELKGKTLRSQSNLDSPWASSFSLSSSRVFRHLNSVMTI